MITTPVVSLDTIHDSAHFWVNLGVYGPNDKLISTGASVPFSVRQKHNKALAIACARKNVLAFNTCNCILAEEDLKVFDNLSRATDEADQAYVDVEDDIAAYYAKNYGITTSAPVVPLVKRLRSRLKTMQVGATVVVYVPSKVGILGVGTVIETVKYGTEDVGLPGFNVTVGIRWNFGPFFSAEDTQCVQIPDFRKFSQETGLVVSSTIQTMKFYQFSAVIKLMV
jgi:hypothetical protein